MTRTKKAARFCQAHVCSGAAASAAVTQDEVFELVEMQLEVLTSELEARFQAMYQQDSDLTSAMKELSLFVKKILETASEMMTFVQPMTFVLAKRQLELRFHSFTFSKARLLELYAKKQPQPLTEVEVACIRAETEALKTCYIKLLQEVTAVLACHSAPAAEPALKKQKTC